jgi:DNA-binding NarL/FixJ family response regulator
MPITVLIADPSPFFCEALAAALPDNDLRVVGWTTDERRAADISLKSDPDVVLTEVALAAGSGLSLSRRLRDRKVLVLTRGHPGDALLDAVEAGAWGCLGHSLSVERLREQIAEAAGGRFVVEIDRLHDTLRRASVRGTGEAHVELARLTGREREVLRLVAEGLEDDAIGRLLYLSPHTVRTHVGNILRKLALHSRADAARLALRSGEGHRAEVLRIQGPELGTG